MSPRVTLLLAVLVALVGAYIFAVDRPQAERAEQAKHLVRVAKTDVTGITLTSAKGTVDLTRVDAAHWTVDRPFQAPAASFAVGDLLDAIAGIVPQRTVEEKTSDLGAYGLDKPGVRVTLRASGGRTLVLSIGKTSPVSTAVYARLEPGSAVYLVDASVGGALSKSAADLRQKTMADFANADVQRVRVTSSKGALAVVRLGADRWRLEGPRPWPADDFKVTDLFFPLTTSDAKTFHDGVGDPAAYGLDHPAVTVELTLKGRKDPLRFVFSRRGKATAAMAVGGRTVLDLDAAVLDRLTPDPLSLVSRRLLPYNAPNLTSLVWRRGGKTLAVRRQGPGFTGGGLSDAQVSELFSALNLVESDKIEPLASPPSGASAFEIQTDGGTDAQFHVFVYAQRGGAWLATDPALGLQYRLTSTVWDGLPDPLKSFLGVAPKAPAGATPPKGAPAAPKGTPQAPGRGPSSAPPQPGKAPTP